MKPTKVHIGNGSIYLREYINVDVWESGSCLAINEPDRVSRWATYDSNYYGNSKWGSGEPLDPNDFVCDVYGSWECLPFESGSMDEILSRQCFEHLSKREAHWGIMEAWRVLRMGGRLRIDVPDHEAALQKYAECQNYSENGLTDAERDHAKAGAEFMMRHLLGSRKDDFAYHMGSWTKEKLIAFCAKRGFSFEKEEKNIHFYPAFCLVFSKVPMEIDSEFLMSPWMASWQYAGNPRGTPLQINPDWKVLEVGPGDDNRRWKRASAYVDRDQRVLDSIQADVPKMIGDAAALPCGDRSFDYIFSSHCLEHCEDPERVANEFARVANAGCIVTPSIGKEAIFKWHESDHKWSIHQAGDKLYFFPLDHAMVDALKNEHVQSIAHKQLRLGAPQYGPDGAMLRKWYRKAEPWLDCIHHWTGKPNIVVMK